MENKNLNNTAKKGKFNLVDAAILLFVALVLALTLPFFFNVFWLADSEPSGQAAAVTPVEERGKLIYTVEIEGLTKEKSEQIILSKNSRVTNYSGDVESGTVLTKIAEQYFVTDEGVETPVEKYRLIISVEISCKYVKGDGYYINGKQLLIGKSLPLRFMLDGRMEELNGCCIGFTYSGEGEANG